MGAARGRLLAPVVAAVLLAACGDGGPAGAPVAGGRGPTGTDPTATTTTQPGLADPDPLVGILEELTGEVRAALADDPDATAGRAEVELQSILLQLLERPGDAGLRAVFDGLRVDVPPIPEQLGPISRAASDAGGPDEPHGFGRGPRAAANPVRQASTAGVGTALAAFADLVHASAQGQFGDWTGSAPGETGHVSIGRLSGRRRIADSATAGDGATVSAEALAEVDVELCPDPEGRVHGRVEFDARAELIADGAGGIGAYHVVIEWTSQVGDDAVLGRSDFTTVVGMSAAAHWSADGTTVRDGAYLELELTGSMEGASAGSIALSGGRALRASRGATSELVEPVAKAGAAITAVLLEQIMETAERYWRDGACVEVRLTPSDGPDGLDPGQDVVLHVDPRARIDDLPTGGRTTVRLIDGGAAVTPADTPLTTPVDVTYVAPRDGGGWVDARSVSRRGIGEGDIEFTVDHGYLVEGSDGVFNVRALKCGGPAGAWHFDLWAHFDEAVFTGTVTAELDPSTLSGPFTLTGATSGGGITVPQSGTGTLSFVEDDAGAAIRIEGDWWAAGGWSGDGREPGEIPVQLAPPGSC